MTDDDQPPVSDSAATATGVRGPANKTPISGDAATEAGSQPPAHTRAKKRPDKIGRFEVLRELGRGAMGVVYAAYDEDLDRKVAIKLLLGDTSASLDYERRLRREARAMAQMVHPNVVAVHEVGTHDGHAFIAMDFIEGSDLRRWLKKPRPWRDVLAVFVQAARGLVAAHAAGVIHRDFKPDNVLLSTEADGSITARVADFGIASAGERGPPTVEPDPVRTDQEGAATTAGSMAGAGTPAYMAPERWDGAAADESTDQFSFCVSLFEALTGARPFVADTLPALATKICEGRRGPYPRRSKVPGWVRNVVDRGLSHAPQARFASMADVVRALEADPTGRRRVFGLAGLAVVTAVTALGGRELSRRADISSCRERSVRRSQAIWSVERSRVLEERFADSDRAYVKDARKLVDQSLAEYAKSFLQIDAQACLSYEVDRTTQLEIHERQQECLEEAARNGALFGDAAMESSDEQLPGLLGARSVMPDLSSCVDVERLAERSRLPEDEDERLATIEALKLIRLAQIRRQAAGPAESLPLAERAADQARSMANPAVLGEALVELGITQQILAKDATAEATLEDAIASAAMSGATVVEVEASMALLWAAGSQHPERVPDLARAAEAAINRLGQPAVKLAEVTSMHGSLLGRQRKFDEAIEKHTHAIAQWKQLKIRDINVASSHNNLGWAYHMKGDTTEAAKHYREALAIKETVLGTHHRTLSSTLINLGMIAREKGDLSTAEADLVRALDLARDAYGDGHPRVAAALAELAIVFNDGGRFAEALARIEEAAGIAEGIENPKQSLLDDIDKETARAKAGLAQGE